MSAADDRVVLLSEVVRAGASQDLLDRLRKLANERLEREGMQSDLEWAARTIERFAARAAEAEAPAVNVKPNGVGHA